MVAPVGSAAGPLAGAVTAYAVERRAGCVVLDDAGSGEALEQEISALGAGNSCSPVLCIGAVLQPVAVDVASLQRLLDSGGHSAGG